MTKALKKYESFTRKEVHDIFSPGTNFTPQTGTWGLQGIIKIPNTIKDYVFFVTYGSIQGTHTFDEGITESGVLTWQSQPKQTLNNKVILDLINHNELTDNIYLFLRPSRKVNSYTFLGTLSYLKHDNQREEPVHFKWQILDWELTPQIASMFNIDLTINSKEFSNKTYNNISKKPFHLEPTPPPIINSTSRSGISTDDFKSSNVNFDESNLKNSELGKSGEDAVIEMEKQTLIDLGLHELASRIESTREKLGTNAPYDVLSFTPDGLEKYIEVKTTKGSINTPFYISAREVLFSSIKPNQYYLYRVYSFNQNTKSGKFYIKQGYIKDYSDLEAIKYKVKMK